MLDSAVPASTGDRLPRNVCMATCRTLSFDQLRMISTASFVSCTGISATCSFISAAVNSRVQYTRVSPRLAINSNSGLGPNPSGRSRSVNSLS